MEKSRPTECRFHSTMDHGNMGGMADQMTEGPARKIDKATSLGMPGMNMVFRVKNPAMLDKVQVGNKVSFMAEKNRRRNCRDDAGSNAVTARMADMACRRSPTRHSSGSQYSL